MRSGSTSRRGSDELAVAGLSVLDDAGRQAAGAFLARCARLDRAALVRLRSAPGGPADVAQADVARADVGPGDVSPALLWVRLPFGALVSCAVRAEAGFDVTVRVVDLLAALATPVVALPQRRDVEWRWSLPPGAGEEVDRLLAADVLRVGAAAAATMRTAIAEGVGGRAVGERALRDGLLDHVPFVVTTAGGDRVPVSQRLVQAVIRMGFMPDHDETPIGVRVVGRWVGLATRFGTAWHRPPSALR